MNIFRQFSFIALTFIACSSRSSLAATKAGAPDERDRQVLETLLLHLLADSKFDMTRVSPKGVVVVLHARTPEKTGFIQADQVHSDIGDHTLPGDAERNLRSRNTKPDAKPNTYEAVTASFTNLTFSAGIVVTDLTAIWSDRPSFQGFETAHPKARGWVEAYLPGYSKDGSFAIVRAGVGPSPHGAMVTALLEKRDKKWSVKWHNIAWYV
jgi:hypothetical protein